MSKVLEIFGRAVAVNAAGIMWRWLEAIIDKDSEDCQLDEVLELVSMGDFRGAAEKITRYLLERPNCIKGRMAASAICIENCDIAGAITNLQSVYYRQPGNTVALYVLGYCYERLGRESEAAAFYQDCLKFKNHLEMPRQRLAAIYLKNHQIERAILEYQQLQRENPGDIKTIILLGHLYLLCKDYPGAKQAFNEAILVHPDNFNSNSENEELKAIMAGYEGAYRAIDYVNNLISENPEAADLYVQLADLLVQAGQMAEGIVYYEKALKLQPNYLEAAVKLGTAQISMGNEMLAAEKFNRAVEINDEIVDAYIGLAQAEILAGEKKHARTTLELAGAIQKNSCILFAESARLRFKTALKQHSRALPGSDENFESGKLVIDAFQKECRSNPGNQAASYGFGLILMKFKKYDQAKKIFDGILVKNPTHHRAQSRSAICSVEMGQKNQAAQSLKIQPKINSEMINLHYKTAVLYSDRNCFMAAMDKANQKLDRIFDTETNSGTLLEVLQNLGVLDRAFACWNTIGEMAQLALSNAEES